MRRRRFSYRCAMASFMPFTWRRLADAGAAVPGGYGGGCGGAGSDIRGPQSVQSVPSDGQDEKAAFAAQAAHVYATNLALLRERPSLERG